MKAKSQILKYLGPGILFASTAIGVSHLVQSTMAGAMYGFALVWAIVAANLFKYPAFEFGSRYANSAGESIITGYRKLGKWMIWAYLFITLGSMFFVTSAVGAVTSGFLENLLGLPELLGENSQSITLISLFIFCMGILIAGKYSALDSLIKVIAVLLLISTVIAVLAALAQGPQRSISHTWKPEIPWSNGGFAFLIALMGWMPTAVDLSAWSSLWTIARIKQTGYKPKLKETLLDFNLGYIASFILAIAFVVLGSYMFFGTEKELPAAAASFANMVVNMYSSLIGDWAYIIIAIAAFSIIFGTCIAVFDGYSRALATTIQVIRGRNENESSPKHYSIVLILLTLGSLYIVFSFGKSMKGLINMATILSFVVAPIIAYANLILVTKHINEEDRPKKWLTILAWCGFSFLLIFSIIYLWALISGKM